MKKNAAVLLVAGMTLAGCSHFGVYDDPVAHRGAVIGGVAGGIIGGVATGSAAGVVVGAGVGAVAGAAIATNHY